MSESIHKFLEVAFSNEVARSSIKVSLIVGTILAVINHGGAILQMSLTVENMA